MERGGRGEGGRGRGGFGKGGYGRGKGGYGKGSSSGPSPALLTANIKKASTLEALLRTVAAYFSAFNHIHLSACWNSMGHLTRAADRSWALEHAAALESLLKHTTKIVSTSSEIRARELATIAHGVAKSGQGSTATELMAALATSIESRVGDCNAQELANTAWAFAKAEHRASALFDALATAAARRVRDFNAQELANTAHAFAKAGHASPALFDAVAATAAPRLREFTPQGLANTVWAYAAAGHASPSLFEAVAAASAPRLREFDPQALANTVWAFAKAGHASPALFDAVVAAAAPRLREFTPQGLANTVWAYATAAHASPSLFEAVAAASAPRLREFDPQALANAAWSYAKACHVDARLFGELARSAEACLDEFNTQDLANIAWAYAKLGQLDAALLTAVARAIGARDLHDLSAPHIANITWAFAKAEKLDGPLFAALARSAEQKVADFGAQDLADIAWSFANAGQTEARLFASLARAAEGLLDEFTDEALDNAEWAFARAGQQKMVKSIRARKKRATGSAAPAAGPLDVSECGQIIVAGGGIGGAAVAVALQAKGFEVTVLEADSSFDARKQGYGLTIQRQDATQAMGIDLTVDDAPSTSHYTFSPEGHVLGFYGEAFGEKSRGRRQVENSGRFVHMPRQQLRARLLEPIRPGTIRWGAKLKSFRCWCDDEGGGRRGQRNGVSATLTDGTTLEGSLLVGSDGIFSTVRSQLGLPGDRLNYVGLVVVLGIMEGELAVPLAERRIFETVDGTTRIYAMPFTTRSTMWQLSFPYAEEAARALVRDPAALRAEILRRCGKWHAPIPGMLRRTPAEGMSGYAVYDRELLEPRVLRRPPPAAQPPGEQPAPQRRVTLIGDAAHPMTPFKAQGANQAMADAVLLADTLAQSVQTHGPSAGLDAALPVFERKMLGRSARAVVGSREKAREMHSQLALQPARKVQREVGLDMAKVIRALRAGRIGAHSAADPRGLDAVVAAAIQASSGPAAAGRGAAQEGSATHERSDRAEGGTKRRAEGSAPAGTAAKKPSKKPKGGGAPGPKGTANGQAALGSAAADRGFKWRRAMCARLDAAAEGAAEGGIRLKHLRKAVLRQYLRHLAQSCEAGEDRAWWEAHPAELKARFRQHLLRAKRNGRLRMQGKMVRRPVE